MVLRLLAAAAVALIAASLPARAGAAPLASTPYMGWSPYYSGEGGSDEATFKTIAQSLISSGLQAAGYKIFWLDYGWASGARDSNGNLTISSTQWPDGMLGFTTWLHQHGFLAGIYTDAGTSGCSSSGVGSYGHYAAGSTNPYSQDVDQFAAWGFDAVKVDFCGAGQQWQFQSPHDPRTLYSEFSSAVANNSSGRPMILNVCDFWDPGAVAAGVPSVADSSWDSYSWAPSIAQSWRTDTDIGFPKNVVFSNVIRNLKQDSTSQTAAPTTPTIQDAAGPPGSSGISWGHWNDPDNLAPGLGMTDIQTQSQFSMWAMVAAPLILGNDPQNLTQAEVSMLENPNVIAIDQDSLGAQGYLLSGQGTTAQVWVKPLANGDRAIALLNTGTSSQQISTTASAAGLAPASVYRLDDLWTNATITTDAGGDITAQVPADGVTLYRVSPAARLSVSLAGDGSGRVNDASGAIACPGACSSVYGQGALVTLAASPSHGSAFAGWSGAGCSGTGACTVSLQGDTGVTATFVPLHTLSVSVIGAGRGTITAPGISCPGSCSASYPEGASVTLSATPDGRSEFGAWLSGGCAPFGSSCTVTVSGDDWVTVGFDPRRSGTAYIALGRRNDVVPIDLASGTRGRPITGFDAPRQIAISPDGGTAFVVNAGNATVTPINLATNTRERAIGGFVHPGPIAVTSDGRTAYVLEDGRRLVPIDLADDQRERVITFSNRSRVGEHAASLALAPNGTTAYLGTFNTRAGKASGTLTEVDLGSGRVKATIRGFGRPAAIAVAPDGATAYVADSSRGSVARINLAAGRVIPAPALIAPGAFPGADGAAVTPDGTSLYIADARPGLLPIDLATGTERPALTGFSSPSAIAIADPPPPGDSVKLSAGPRVSGSSVTDTVTCLASRLSCTTTQALTVIELRGLVATVARRTVTIPARHTARVTLRVNTAGRRLVSELGRLPMILSVAIRRGDNVDTLAVRQLVVKQ